MELILAVWVEWTDYRNATNYLNKTL